MLLQMYVSSDLSNATDLQVQLTTLRMTGDETLRSYWSRAIHIQTRLNGINMNTPDTTLQIWLLRGLPPAYDHYKDIATNHAGANVDIYAMLAFLQVHEVKHHVKQA